MAAEVRHSSLLATLTLLYEPWRWIHHVDEVVSIHRTEIVRHVHAHYRLPDSNLASNPVLPDALDSTDAFFLPLLTPRKDKLVDLQEITCEHIDGSYLVSHQEHLDISSQLVRARLMQTWLQPLTRSKLRLARANGERITADLKKELGRDAAQSLSAIGNKVFKEISGDASTAAERLGKLFHGTTEDSVPPVFAEVGGFPRPTDEQRLYLLCKLLAERYIKFVCLPTANLGNDVTIDYRYRQEYHADPRDNRRSQPDRRLDPVREILGTTPSHLRFFVPLARRTPHYVFRFAAPEGHFFHEAGFVQHGDILDGETYFDVPLSSAEDDSPGSAKELGGGAEALLMLANGHTAAEQLDCAFVNYELPPGTAGFTTAVAALVLVLMFSMTVLRAAGALEESVDTAALIVAVAGYAGVIASPFLPRTDLYTSPLFSRVALLGTGVLSSIFALWLAMEEPLGGFGSSVTSELLRWFHDNGWLLCVVPMSYFLLGSAKRLITLAIYFADARRPLRKRTIMDTIVYELNGTSDGHVRKAPNPRVERSVTKSGEMVGR